MPVTKLEKNEWALFFNGVSRALENRRAEIEVASPEIGRHTEAHWLPLLGMVYDHKDDLVEVVLDGVDHLIFRPRDIYVDVGTSGLASIEVIEADDTRQIVKIRDPIMLPPPE